MRPILQRRLRPFLLLAALACGAGAQAQALSPIYALTVPALPLEEPAPVAPLVGWGALRLDAAATSHRHGLSLEAGRRWFARAGIGRSIDADGLSLGGGYRFADGGALSMHVTRQLGQERLGLAVRYDLRHSYLRLAYESPLRAAGQPDSLRFSAGLRF